MSLLTDTPVSVRSYDDVARRINDEPCSRASRETLPFRASIRDFDLDPPLTYKGLKDAFHTGTQLFPLSLSCLTYRLVLMLQELC